MELSVGFIALGTSALNVVLFYIEPKPGYWSMIFDKVDYAACCAFLIVYLLKWYVSTHRLVYLFSMMSILDLIIMLPSLILIDVQTTTSRLYFLIPFSRYIRVVISFLILQRYFKLG
jgi:hypothetical protein